MKKLIILFNCLLLLSILLAPPAPTAAQTATVVRVNPSPVYLEVGQTATIEIRVENVVDLFGFAVEIHFDPTKISAASTVLGDFLEPGLTAVDEIDNINGTITFEMAQFGSETTSKSGSGILLTFEITLLEEVNQTSLVIDSILLTDRNGVEIPCDAVQGVVKTLGFSAYAIFLPLVIR